MKIRLADSNWHTLTELVSNKCTVEGHQKKIKSIRKDLTAKAMTAIDNAIKAESTRMKTSPRDDNRPVKPGRVVITIDIEFETEYLSNEPYKGNKSLLAEIDDILNRKPSAKDLLEY